MRDDGASSPSAGWYDDPGGSGDQRFWDGTRWTDKTRTVPPSGATTSRWSTGRWMLVAGALVAALIMGAGVGILIGAPSGGDAPDASTAAPDDPTPSDEGELPSALQLVGEIDQPTDLEDSVTFVDVEALRSAEVVGSPDPDGGGWTLSEDLRSAGTLLMDLPYHSLEQLGRSVPMDRVVGLTFDEISASVGSVSDGGWFVPSSDTDLVRERIEDSPAWSESGPGTFERVGEFTSDTLGGFEPRRSEQNVLDTQIERLELADGALRLDSGRLTQRDDPLRDDAGWASTLDRLASEQAVSGWLVPHDQMQDVIDGGQPLQPAQALAMASVIDDDGLRDLLVLEHDDPAVAESNAAAARNNLGLLTDNGRFHGEVTIDGTTVLLSVGLTGDDAGSSHLHTTLARHPSSAFSLLVGTEGAAADPEPSRQEPGSSTLDGATITVGSKDFDEQLILGEISKALLEDAGAEVVDELDLGSTFAARDALIDGEIDHYWEYNGTAWIEFYEQDEPIADRVGQYEAVRDREVGEGLYWLDPSPFNNTYGIALSQGAYEEFGTETFSDLGELLEEDPDAATLCVESEFESRSDGLPGMEAHYGFEFPTENVEILDIGVIYGATADRDPCNFGEVFTTDGRIAALNLHVLEDDLSFFPYYNASPVFTQQLYEQYGEALNEVYAPVTAALDNETMAGLNAQVATGGERPEDVARDWLSENGFIR